jgi:hypothetical protein
MAADGVPKRDERFVIEGDPEDALRALLTPSRELAEMSIVELEQELADCRRDVEGNEEALRMALEDARRRQVDPTTDRAVRIVRENVVRAEANLHGAEQAHKTALDAGTSP